jgi:PAS domain S-box-containing protein
LEPARPIDLADFTQDPRTASATLQSHGIVAVVSMEQLTIEAISDVTDRLLGIPAGRLIGEPIDAIIDAGDAAAFAAKLRDPRLASINPHALSLAGADGPLAVECTVLRAAGRHWLLAFEPADRDVVPPGYEEAQEPIERLTRAPDIASLLASAAEDLRALAGFDRALVYRFDADWQCEIVAEAVAPGVGQRYLGKPLASAYVSESIRRLFLRSSLLHVSDSGYRPAHLVANEPRSLPLPEELALTPLRGLAPADLDTFVRTGSRATLTIPLVIRGRLWGLVACHNAQPRLLRFRKRAACELVGNMLAWQLDTRLERERLGERSRVTALYAEIAAAIDAADDVGRAVIDSAPSIFELLGADGLAVCVENVVRRAGKTPLDDAKVAELAAELNARADNGVAAHTSGPAALYLRLASDGGTFVVLFRTSGRARKWSRADVRAALTLRGRLAAGLQTISRQHAEHTRDVDVYLGDRNAQAAALIKLHEDVASALPSREAIVDVILAFARRQTAADGGAIETLSETENFCEAATGILAALRGKRMRRAGSLSGKCVDLGSALIEDDTLRDAGPAERDACLSFGVTSLLVVPITVAHDEAIVLKVGALRRGAFSDDDIQTLKLAATNLRKALRAAREFAALADAEREQRAYARRLRALHAIASTTHSNRKDQIDAALALGLEQLDLDWGFLGVFDYAAHEFVFENSVGNDGSRVAEAGVRTPLGGTIVGRVAQDKGVRIVQDATQLGQQPGLPGWASSIVAPLFIGGVHYGTIGFTSRDARQQPFSEANVEFIAVAAELISSAVERGLQRERLESSETRYRALTEAIPELVWVVDGENRCEYVNARWSAYTGLSIETIRGRTCEGIIEPEHLPVMMAKRSAVPPAEYECEVRLRRADGTLRWHLVRSVPFADAAGNGGNWLVTATDIEARKSAETLVAGSHEAALAATEAKSRFLATMSHEIRTPMNAVIGMTELLLLTQLSDEQREYIEIVRDSGQSLLRVLNDILDYSKIEAGKLELETVEFDLPGQIESVVELLRAQYQIKGVALATSFGADIPAIVAGDPGRLRQILLNLAGNALKFTPAGGRVHIDVATARADVQGVRFIVEDTGIGIAPDVVRRLFQPFSQGDESTTRKYGGTGLGLSICAQLVALMNGTIGVRSTAGEGSAFWFQIPLRPAPNSSKTVDSRKRGAVRSKPVVMRAEKILLVEDNEINTFLALKQLQRIGFQVSAVTNGRQAIEAVTSERFDLVFMDCHMPEMDGFAATREIRRLEGGGSPHLPIVAMTADARTEDHENCLRAGMDDYVSKPTSLESLRLVLDRWLPSPDRRQNTRTTISRTGPGTTLRVTKLLELFAGDRGAVITLLTAAAGSIRSDFARIEQCAASGESAAVAEAAHRLKGTAASIRAPRLGEISSAIERAASAPRATISEALMAELRAAVDALIADVEKHSKVLATIG